MITKNVLIDRCDKFMAFCFYALIYFLPISIALAETFINLALVTFFIKRGTIFRKKLKEGDLTFKGSSFYQKILIFFKFFKPVSSWLNLPIAGLLFFSMISIIFSQYPGLSVNGFFGKTLQNAFIYFTFIECINSKKRLKIFLITFFVSFVLICINGLFQYYVGHGFIHGHIFDGQIASSWRQANDFGSYLVVGVPVLFCILSLIVNGQREKISQETTGFSFLSWPLINILVALIFLLSLICLGLTYSRGAWLAFAVSMVFLSIKNIKKFFFIVLFLFIFGIIFVPGMMDARADLNSLHRFFENNNRILYWRGALEIIKDYPIFGAGLNTYSLVRSQYNLDWGGYPHNGYLHMLAEIGFLGFFSFLWVIFTLMRNAIKSLSIFRIASLKILFLGFLSGLSAFLFHAFWDTTFYSVQLASLMWIIMGLIVTIEKLSKEDFIN